MKFLTNCVVAGLLMWILNPTTTKIKFFRNKLAMVDIGEYLKGMK